jgi:prophage regulatory protein
MPRIIRLPEVRRLTGQSTSQIYDGIKRGSFPAPATLFEGARAVGWFDDEIDSYNESRRKARDEKLAERATGQARVPAE